jgi:hypothetical protein
MACTFSARPVAVVRQVGRDTSFAPTDEPEAAPQSQPQRLQDRSSLWKGTFMNKVEHFRTSKSPYKASYGNFIGGKWTCPAFVESI